MALVKQKPERSFCLEDYRVGNIKSVYYLKDYLSPEEQALLVKCVEAPCEEHSVVQTKSGRSLKVFGGEVTPQGLID